MSSSPGGLSRRLRGIRGGSLALARAAPFIGLLLAGTVLLIATVAPLLAVGLGLGHLVQDVLRGSLAPDGQDWMYLLGVLIGAACGWLVLPAALLTVRGLAGHTRRLSARWCGVPIRQAYAPRPRPATRRGRWPGGGGLGYRPLMSWLLTDQATWRDLLWLAVNTIVGLVLLLVPLLLFGSGIIAFIIPALGSLPWFNGLQHLSLIHI